MLTTNFVPGAPNWVEVTAPDLRAAGAFYGAMFGWEFSRDGRASENYAHFQLDGKDVAAATRISETTPGITWTLYFHTADANATAKSVELAGGTVLVPPDEVPGAGRLAVFADPCGAAFRVWQPGEIIGLEVAGRPNSLWWAQLYTPDVGAARSFYRAALAWDTEDMVLARGAEYTVVSPSGGGTAAAHGGMMPPPPSSTGTDVTLGWHPYFEVADCDTSVAVATEHGATVVFPPETAAGIGRQATLRDPFGAQFSVATPPTEG
jgi:predicted enzyme related to lactoylglutathione lyase